MFTYNAPVCNTGYDVCIRIQSNMYLNQNKQVVICQSKVNVVCKVERQWKVNGQQDRKNFLHFDISISYILHSDQSV